MSGSDTALIHATTVAIAERAVVILGPSGAGKSSLALQLIALGAHLVADDQTALSRQGNVVIADVPDTIKGLIEARGVGLLQVPPAGPTPVHLVVDLSRTAQPRLPHPQVHDLLGCALPCLHKADTAHFPSAILLYMKGNAGPQDAI